MTRHAAALLAGLVLVLTAGAPVIADDAQETPVKVVKSTITTRTDTKAAQPKSGSLPP